MNALVRPPEKLMQVGLSIRYGFDMASLNNLIHDIELFQNLGQDIVV
jgi:hypothetical protein